MHNNWTVEENFPKTNKVAILFSGGAESTLLALLACKYYGTENVHLIYSDAIFCDNHNTVKGIIKQNVSSVSSSLKLPVSYIEIDFDQFSNNPLLALNNSLKTLESKWSVSHVLMGLTKMVWDVLPLQNLNVKEIEYLCKSDPEKFHHVIDQFHLKTGYYLEWLGSFKMHNDICKTLELNHENFHFPFRNLYKQDIINLYFKCSFEDYLPLSISCMKGLDGHCGKCFDCQNRFDAHYLSGHPDKTTYLSDDVIIRRLKL